MTQKIHINGRDFFIGDKPVVVVTVDGNEPEYFDVAMEKGLMPYVKGQKEKGLLFQAKSQLPSTTNTNNVSIITGVTPAEHGICGNYYYDVERDEDIMMHDPDLVRVPTILAEVQKAGFRVAGVTAKDKLRKMLAKDLDFSQDTAICFSSEYSASTNKAEHGIDNAEQFTGMQQPEVYSGELSEFVMKAGVKLLDTFKPHVMYLTLTDYIQHTYAPDEDGALTFYQMLDTYFKQLDEAGCTLVITADHGMNAKTHADGSPKAVYINSLINTHLPEVEYRTILPITDPYVSHHGALGALAYIYVSDADAGKVTALLEKQDGVYSVTPKDEAVKTFNLAGDRIGDLVVSADAPTVLGKTPEDHDLSKLHRKLRSHGGFFETNIPMVTNFAIDGIKGKPEQLKNSDAFWLGLNVEK